MDRTIRNGNVYIICHNSVVFYFILARNRSDCWKLLTRYIDKPAAVRQGHRCIPITIKERVNA